MIVWQKPNHIKAGSGDVFVTCRHVKGAFDARQQGPEAMGRWRPYFPAARFTHSLTTIENGRTRLWAAVNSPFGLIFEFIR